MASQFDHEPYTFFSKLLACKFGVERLLNEEKRLRALMERLRSELFRVQIEGHVRELYRMVNKQHGRVYFSVELFRSPGEGDHFFLVREIPRVMDLLGKYFVFDFQALPLDRAFQQIGLEGSLSVIQSYLLAPAESIA